MPLQPNAINRTIEDAHIAVCTNIWTADELGHLMATVTEEQTLEILRYLRLYVVLLLTMTLLSLCNAIQCGCL